MTDIVMALRLRIEDDEAPLHDHELHRHALKAIQELRGKLQTVAEAYTRMNRETGAEINRLRNLVDQCDHHEHSLQEAQARIAELDGFLETANEQAVALEDANGRLLGIIRRAAMEALGDD